MGKPMDAGTYTKYKARARIVKAMAHPTRLFVMDELYRHGEQYVWKLTQMVGADMSTLSRHLAILKGAGLVEEEKRGLRVYYRVRLACALNVLDCVESIMKCGKLEASAEAAAKQSSLDAQVEKVTDMNETTGSDTLAAPALADDGEVKSIGRVLSVDDVKRFLQ